MFKAIHGIHRQSLIIRKINRFDNRSASIRSVTKKVYKVVYFTITCKFDSDFFSFAVFAVNFIGGMTDKLIEKTDSGLRHIVAV